MGRDENKNLQFEQSRRQRLKALTQGKTEVEDL